MADPAIQRNPKGAYVYEVIVDGIVRYIGKGRNGRAKAHVLEAIKLNKRRAQGEIVRTTRFYNGLASALRRGKTISWRVVVEGLTDEAAYEMEKNQIQAAAKDQLWNILCGGLGGDPEFFKEFWKSEDARKANGDRVRKQWKEPAFRQKMMIVMKERGGRPEFRSMRSEEMKARFTSDEYKERHAELTRERWRKDRKNIAANLQRGREAAREKFSAATTKKWSDPEWREKLCRAQKARWTPEARAKRSELMKKKCLDPVFREKQAETQRRKWQDPEYRERQIRLRWKND